MKQLAAAILIILIILSAAAICYGRDYDYVIEQDIVYEISAHPYYVSNALPSGIERCNLDLSLDGGSNWTHRIAHGIQPRYGTNTYHLSLHVTEDMWTEHARIAIRDLWTSASNAVSLGVLDIGDMSDNDFAIGGLRITSPAAETTVYSPSYTPITWHEAGTEYVKLALSTNGNTFVEQVVLLSASPTNSYVLPIVDMPTGPLWLAVWAVGSDDLYDIIKLNCINIYQ